MHIRKALPDDANAIATIHVHAWQAAYRGIMPALFLQSLSISRREDFWRQQLQRDEATMLLAEEHGRVLGWAQVGPSRDADASPHTAELYAIHVAPENWRQGVGQHLWGEAIVHLRRAPISDTTLWVLRENVRALAFYQANRFVPDVGVEQTIQIAGSELVEIRLRYTLDG